MNGFRYFIFDFSRHDITDEDNYEDFGEGEELESQSEADTPSHTRGHM